MHAAEDIWMEAMVEYWEKRSSLPPDTNIPAYILTAVKHKALNHLRHASIKNEIEATIHTRDIRELHLRVSSLEACEPSELFAGDVKKIIRDTFGILPEQTRRIFYLSRIGNRKNREIADLLHISIKTVEFHIGKALKVFSERLKDYLHVLF
jgi:RNA polymerase sigma-70 factor (ECF subfamily)